MEPSTPFLILLKAPGSKLPLISLRFLYVGGMYHGNIRKDMQCVQLPDNVEPNSLRALNVSCSVLDTRDKQPIVKSDKDQS